MPCLCGDPLCWSCGPAQGQVDPDACDYCGKPHGRPAGDAPICTGCWHLYIDTEEDGDADVALEDD